MSVLAAVLHTNWLAVSDMCYMVSGPEKLVWEPDDVTKPTSEK